MCCVVDDETRVKLAVVPGNEGSDYINASWLNVRHLAGLDRDICNHVYVPLSVCQSLLWWLLVTVFPCIWLHAGLKPEITRVPVYPGVYWHAGER